MYHCLNTPPLPDSPFQAVTTACNDIFMHIPFIHFTAHLFAFCQLISISSFDTIQLTQYKAFKQFCFYRIVLLTYGRLTDNCLKAMLSATTSPSAPAAVILDITSDNWAQFNKAYTLSCYTKFGPAGQKILSNKDIPLTPFAVAPTNSRRCSHTRSETALPGFDLATISLTESANREYRDDLKLYTAAARIFAQSIASTICIDTSHYHLIHP